MKMMMPCTHYITIAVVNHIIHCCFTEMHLCPILVLVDVIVKARFVSDKDSRIQINLFATTNTFCYGINKQDIQYMYKTN